MFKPGHAGRATVAGMTQTIFPAVRYRDADAALAFLKDAFGATEHVVYRSEDGTIQHAEIVINGEMIMFGGYSERPAANAADAARFSQWTRRPTPRAGGGRISSVDGPRRGRSGSGQPRVAGSRGDA
jgi:hypothetical protein